MAERKERSTLVMTKTIAVLGGGVSGLTSGIVLAERGHLTVLIAERMGTGITSAAAAAIWFPYHTGPTKHAIGQALETYGALLELSRDPNSGVSIIEFRKFSRRAKIEVPKWARLLHARDLGRQIPSEFTSGYSLKVPLMDTTVYLDYLRQRFRDAGGQIVLGRHLTSLGEVDPEFEVIVNYTGIGARLLAQDPSLEPHRGQVAIVAKMDLASAVACDDLPLMYVIPRPQDCVFGGTNELSEDCSVDPRATDRIVEECSTVLRIKRPEVLAEHVGLRPFRRSGVRLQQQRLRDGRSLIHNYGHGGAGFTLSWSCARAVARFIDPDVI